MNLITYEITNLERRYKTLKRNCLTDDSFVIMKPYIFLERVGSFYKNKIGYLLKNSWWFFIRIKQNILLEGERVGGFYKNKK